MLTGRHQLTIVLPGVATRTTYPASLKWQRWTAAQKVDSFPMRYGTVVQYFPEKGFGFIQADRGEDIFFHISMIPDCDPQLKIEPGQAVKYELMSRAQIRAENKDQQSDKEPKGRKQPVKPKAQLVELIDKIPGVTLEDDEQKQRLPRHPRSRKKKPTWRR